MSAQKKAAPRKVAPKVTPKVVPQEIEPKEVAPVEQEAKGYTFFSEVDMRDGKVASEYPVWMFRSLLEDLYEDIRRDEYSLKQGIVPESQLPAMRDRLKRNRVKVDQVENSRPVLSERQDNDLNKAEKHLAKEIRTKMFSRSDMKRGLADSHEEARRMVEPSIQVTPEVERLAEACNTKLTSDTISRGTAERLWKMARAFRGEVSNTEILRRD